MKDFLAKLFRSQSKSQWLIGAALSAFALCAYGPAITAPFVGDDYVFLDEVRDARFVDLWSLKNTAFGWYRPWSREFHFWTLQLIMGAHPAPFRIASLVLWIVALSLFFVVVSLLSTQRTALVATLGLAASAMWGGPLLWISGSQDLWMLVFALLSMVLYLRRRRFTSLVAYVGALLSKETGAVIPLVQFACDVIVIRTGLRRATRNVLPSIIISTAWLLFHPTLLKRLAVPAPLTVGVTPRPELQMVLWKTLLTAVNGDRPLNALDWTAFDAVRTAASTLVLVVAVAIAVLQPAAEPKPRLHQATGRIAYFGLAWAIAGWLPLAMPSVGWQSYYGCLGMCGLWLTIGVLLAPHGRLSIVVVALLGLLRGGSAATRSWDWGSEWYQRRAGNMLGVIQTQLKQQAPRLPHYSRVYFGSIPNNIGLIAGQSPAIRVWYGDKTLEAGFYSYFRRRGPGGALGEDRFFHFDSTLGLTEVHLGAEDIQRGFEIDPNWERNHWSVAIVLMRGGDPISAGIEFEKLARLPSRPDALMFAAIAWERAGRIARRDSLFAAAQARTGGSERLILEWARRLREVVPQAPE